MHANSLVIERNTHNYDLIISYKGLRKLSDSFYTQELCQLLLIFIFLGVFSFKNNSSFLKSTLIIVKELLCTEKPLI